MVKDKLHRSKIPTVHIDRGTVVTVAKGATHGQIPPNNACRVCNLEGAEGRGSHVMNPKVLYHIKAFAVLIPAQHHNHGKPIWVCAGIAGRDGHVSRAVFQSPVFGISSIQRPIALIASEACRILKRRRRGKGDVSRPAGICRRQQRKCHQGASLRVARRYHNSLIPGQLQRQLYLEKALWRVTLEGHGIVNI
jgi:hypothetical protein